ncbi:hypothetical protein JG688_00018350, partial [Phytophthora aleatoria]
GAGTTPLYLTSTVNYDTDANTCKSGLPSLVTTTVVAVDVCSPTTTCTGQAAPYTGTSCSSTLTYKDDIAAAFGVNPYVIVEKYNAGQSCAAAQLSSIATYLADGKCHKTDTAKSYRVTRSADNSAAIKTFTDSTCGTGVTVLPVTASQTANSCVTGATGIADTKVYYGGSATPLYLSSMMTSTLTYKDDIAAVFGVNPYVIVEKYNAGKSCADAELSGITTYLADGKCYKTDTAKSYRVTRSADNSASIKTYTDAVCNTGVSSSTVSAADGTAHSCVSDTKVYGAGATPLYLSSTVNYDTSANTCKLGLPSSVATTVVAVDVCSPTTTCTGQAAPYTGTSCSSTLTYKDDMAAVFGVNPYVIVEKYNAGQSCATDQLTGVTTYLADGKCHKTDTAKSYRATRKADNSATVQSYTDAVCGTAVYGAGTTPLYLTSTVSYDTNANSCKSGLPSYVTTTVGAFAVCDDMAAAFGPNPYVIVQKYNSGQSCAAAELSSVTTYLADGKCHKTDTAKSYRATRKADNSATVQSYTDAVCGTGETVTPVSASQGTSNACTSDTKVYGAGTTPLYLTSTVNYDTDANTCSSGAPTVSSYKADMAAAFGSNPYLIVKTYNTGKKCAAAELSGVTTYLADGKCHKTGSSTSYAATRSADGSAVIQSYTDATCGVAGTRLTVTAAQTANSCAADAGGILDTKVL